MPLLLSGAERCALRPGTYTVGGRTPNSLPLSSLELSPEVATIVVPESGSPTIQRLTASIVVRLDQTAIGIAPKPLPDGVEIEFNGCRLTFSTDDAGEATMTEMAEMTSAPIAEETAEYPVDPAMGPRIVHTRSGDTIDLNGSRLIIGRDDTCDVIVTGMDVSRRHCSIMPVQGGFYRWTRAAFGDFWGFQCGWWNWIGTFLLNSSYGVLLMNYLGTDMTIAVLAGAAVFNIVLVLPLVPLALHRPIVA